MTKEQELKQLWDVVVKTAKTQNWRKEDEMFELAKTLLPTSTEVSVCGDFDFRNAVVDGVTVFSDKLHDGSTFDDRDGFFNVRTLGDLLDFFK